MKIKFSSIVAIPLLAWTLSFQPASVSVNSKDVCVGCLKCLEHAQNPLCNCQKICALAVEKGCIDPARKPCPY